VIETHADGVLAGHAALFGATAHNRTATFAIMIGPPHQNRGLGTEATRLALRFGFDELGLHRIQLVVNGFHERGIATYKKVGFVAGPLAGSDLPVRRLARPGAPGHPGARMARRPLDSSGLPGVELRDQAR
jgi:ribosomal protein S18 acetylase RimI-like enzyme